MLRGHETFFRKRPECAFFMAAWSHRNKPAFNPIPFQIGWIRYAGLGFVHSGHILLSDCLIKSIPVCIEVQAEPHLILSKHVGSVHVCFDSAFHEVRVLH
jgi:hypothetical protein